MDRRDGRQIEDLHVGGARQLFIAAAEVSGALVLVSLGFFALVGPPGTQGWTGTGVAHLVSGVVAQMLPFGAFAAGLAASRGSWLAVSARRRLIVTALAIAVATWGLSAWATPLLEHAIDIERGADVTALRPFGPGTPGGLLRHRDYLRLHPPDQYRYSVNAPLARPPSWLDYQLHLSIAYACFALLNAMAGYLVGLLTSSLPGRRRRLVRWGIGLVGGIVFSAAVAIAAGWQRANPEGSGALMAWVPLLIPALQCWLLYAVVRRSGLRLHDEEPDRV